jgi:pyroglutamyl-peptidase
MSSPLILVTGFGPYEEVEENPSARIVERLDADPPDGIELFARILPVSFRGATSGLDAALAALAPRRPDALLSLGVHKKGKRFRIERRATTRLKSGRPDMLGVDAKDLQLADAPALETTLDIDPLAAALEQGGASSVDISDRAGGYVCERLYRHALERSVELGFPSLFIHLPAMRHVSVEKQFRPMRSLLIALARQVAS